MGDTHAEAHRRTRRARALVAPVALAQSTYPEKIALPDGFAPEGIEIALGHTFYVGSVQTGAIYVGDLRTGARDPLVDGAMTQRVGRLDDARRTELCRAFSALAER